jgi:hypothetical protein
MVSRRAALEKPSPASAAFPPVGRRRQSSPEIHRPPRQRRAEGGSRCDRSPIPCWEQKPRFLLAARGLRQESNPELHVPTRHKDVPAPQAASCWEQKPRFLLAARGLRQESNPELNQAARVVSAACRTASALTSVDWNSAMFSDCESLKTDIAAASCSAWARRLSVAPRWSSTICAFCCVT